MLVNITQSPSQVNTRLRFEIWRLPEICRVFLAVFVSNPETTRCCGMLQDEALFRISGRLGRTPPQCFSMTDLVKLDKAKHLMRRLGTEIQGQHTLQRAARGLPSYPLDSHRSLRIFPLRGERVP